MKNNDWLSDKWFNIDTYITIIQNEITLAVINDKILRFKKMLGLLE